MTGARDSFNSVNNTTWQYQIHGSNPTLADFIHGYHHSIRVSEQFETRLTSQWSTKDTTTRSSMLRHILGPKLVWITVLLLLESGPDRKTRKIRNLLENQMLDWKTKFWRCHYKTVGEELNEHLAIVPRDPASSTNVDSMWETIRYMLNGTTKKQKKFRAGPEKSMIGWQRRF
ncbi:hypothetical protein HUJ04_005173 [Dendroctonus ponderosae]|nr:hypothetical protein HUJ04_005173 [Dendroctonus ponderosae]